MKFFKKYWAETILGLFVLALILMVAIPYLIAFLVGPIPSLG